MKRIKRLLIIPARLNSRRVKNKNIKLFFKKPMISYPIKTALKSKLFSKIHVSTESKKILRICKNYGIEADCLRPKTLSTSKVDLFSVFKFVKNFFDKKNYFFNEYWVLLPCSPLLDKNDLLCCSKLIKKFSCPVMTVSPYPKPLNWSLKIKKNEIIPNSKIWNRNLSKQEHFYDAGQLYCFPKKYLEKKKFSFKNFRPYVLPLEKSVDVDSNKDWNFMEKLFLIRSKIK